MKTWLTYLAAAAMGLAFELTFRDSLFFVSSMNFMADVVMKLGAFIVFPLAFFTMAAGTASLSRRRGRTSFVWLSTIFWAILTSLVLSVCAALVFRIIPTVFPATSTTPSASNQYSALTSGLYSSTAARLVSANPLSVNAFFNFIKSSDCLLPVIFIALIFGYAVRPTTEVIRPAYITLNSISETMFRLARLVARFLWIGLFFLSGAWFYSIFKDGSVHYSWRFLILCILLALVVLFGAIPLIYSLATGFKRNPYKQIARLIPASVAAFFSVNYLFSQSALYTDCRTNLGIHKNIVSTTLPLHSVLTKGGSALVSTMCTCSLIFGITGSLPTVLQTVTVAFACTLVSFVSCLHAGYEVLFTVSFALGLLDLNLSGTEFSVIGLLPLLNGLALMIDVMLAGLGTSFTACHLKSDCDIVKEDTV
ncbi:MAG: cation:dicarboxylase symporter family transporter [Spirochaetales bacterium]|nr:cation:dicarboxylase symporter family transporter [Spirochaetales bacterium]MBP5757275.1 cation:dicarboxylase symporter family transporter [Spirochaetales bacterium]